LLGYIIERCQGEEYAGYISRNIFEPVLYLMLAQAGFDLFGVVIPPGYARFARSPGATFCRACGAD